MVHLELVSEYGTISLDEVFNLGKGVEALSGVTGFGLPPVDAQYQSGAGDGAQFRYLRYKERDIDIPFYLAGDDREELKEIHRDLMRALTSRYPCTLRFVDGAESWVLDVKRVGGGDYIYGKDTTGDTDLKTIITVRAGDPFWRKEQHVAVDLPGEGGTFAYDNTGDAPSPPVVTLTGPACDFVATSDTGETLEWDGVLQDAEELVIDFAAKTAIDSEGKNRYGEFAPAPQFWSMLPGPRNLSFELDNSSDEFLAAYATVDFNYITNPTFHTDLTGWSTETRKKFSAPVTTAEFVQGTGSPNADGWLSIRVPKPGYAGVVKTTLSGLEIGASYKVRTLYRWQISARSKKHSPPWMKVQGVKGLTGANITSTTARELTFDFVATSSSHVLELGSGSVTGGSTTTAFWSTFCIESVKSTGYFDGDTADTADYTYDWSGTPHASKSFRALEVEVDTTNTNINIEWAPRKLSIV